MSSLGENIRACRLERCITQVQMAKALGTSQSVIGGYERNESEPSLAVIERIADYFQVDPRSLLPFKTDRTSEETIILEALRKDSELKSIFYKVSALSLQERKTVSAIIDAIAHQHGSTD